MPSEKAMEMANSIFAHTSYSQMPRKIAEFIDLWRTNEAEVKKLRQTHWDMRAQAGFDNDGDPTPEHVVSDFSVLMIDDWNTVIRDQQEGHDEWDNLQQENLALAKALDFMCTHAHQPNCLELRDGFAEAKQVWLCYKEKLHHQRR